MEHLLYQVLLEFCFERGVSVSVCLCGDEQGERQKQSEVVFQRHLAAETSEISIPQPSMLSQHLGSISNLGMLMFFNVPD